MYNVVYVINNTMVNSISNMVYIDVKCASMKYKQCKCRLSRLTIIVMYRGQDWHLSTIWYRVKGNVRRANIASLLRMLLAFANI